MCFIDGYTIVINIDVDFYVIAIMEKMNELCLITQTEKINSNLLSKFPLWYYSNAASCL